MDLRQSSVRLLSVAVLALGVVGVSGCVVVPAYPAYGPYGYARGVVVAPSVVYPPPHHWRRW